MLLCNVALVVNNAVHFRDEHQYSSLLYQNANETMMKSKRQGLTDEERLLRVIMQDYDPISRPVHNASDSVLVTLGLALIQIQKMVTSLSEATAYFLFFLEIHIDFL